MKYAGKVFLTVVLSAGLILPPEALTAQEYLAPPHRNEDLDRMAATADFRKAVRAVAEAGTTEVKAEAIEDLIDSLRRCFNDPSLSVTLMEKLPGAFVLEGAGEDGKTKLLGLMVPAKAGEKEILPGYAVRPVSRQDIAKLVEEAGQPDRDIPVVLAEWEMRDGAMPTSLPALLSAGRGYVSGNMGLDEKSWEEFFLREITPALAERVRYLREAYPGMNLFEGPRKVRLVSGSMEIFEPHRADGTLILGLDLFWRRKLETSLPEASAPFAPDILQTLQIAALLHQELHEAPKARKIVDEACFELSDPVPAAGAREWLICLAVLSEMDSALKERPALVNAFTDSKQRLPGFFFPEAMVRARTMDRVHAMKKPLLERGIYSAARHPDLVESMEFLSGHDNYAPDINRLYSMLVLRMEALRNPSVAAVELEALDPDSKRMDKDAREAWSSYASRSMQGLAVYSDTDDFGPQKTTKRMGPEEWTLKEYQDALAEALRRESGPLVMLVAVSVPAGVSAADAAKLVRDALEERRAWLKAEEITLPVLLIPWNPSTRIPLIAPPKLEWMSPWSRFWTATSTLGFRRPRFHGDHFGDLRWLSKGGDAIEVTGSDRIAAMREKLSPAMVDDLAEKPALAAILAVRPDLTPKAQRVLSANPEVLPALLNNTALRWDSALWTELAANAKGLGFSTSLIRQIRNPAAASALWQAMYARDPAMAVGLLQRQLAPEHVHRILVDLHNGGFTSWRDVISANYDNGLSARVLEGLLESNPAILGGIVGALLEESASDKAARRALDWLAKQTDNRTAAESVLRDAVVRLDGRFPGLARLAAKPFGEMPLLGERVLPLSFKAHLLLQAARLLRSGAYSGAGYAEALEKALLRTEVLEWFGLGWEKNPKLMEQWLHIVAQVPWMEEFQSKKFQEKYLEFGNQDVIGAYAAALDRIQFDFFLGPAFASDAPDARRLLSQAMEIALTPKVLNKQVLFSDDLYDDEGRIVRRAFLKAAIGALPPGMTLEQLIASYAGKPDSPDKNARRGIPDMLFLPLLYRFGWDPEVFQLVKNIFDTPGVHRSRRIREVLLNYLLPDRDDARFRRHAKRPKKLPLLEVLRLAEKELKAGTLSYRWQEKLPDWIAMVDFLDGLGERYDSKELKEFVENIAGEPSLAQAESRAKDLMLDAFKHHLPGQWTDRELSQLDMNMLENVANYWIYDKQWEEDEQITASPTQKAALKKARELLARMVDGYLKGGQPLKDLKYGGTPESKLQMDVNRKALENSLTAQNIQAGMNSADAKRKAQADADVYVSEWKRDLDEWLDISDFLPTDSPVQVTTDDDVSYWLRFGETGGGFCMIPQLYGSNYTKALLGRALSAIFKAKQVARYDDDKNSTVFEALVPNGNGELILVNEVLYTAFEGQEEKLSSVLAAVALSAIRNAGRYGAQEIMIPKDPRAKHMTIGGAVNKFKDKLAGLTVLVEHRDESGEKLLWAEKVSVESVELGEAQLVLAPETNRWKYWVAVDSRWTAGERGEYFREKINEDWPVEYDGLFPIRDIPGIEFNGMKISYSGFILKLSRERMTPREVELYGRPRDARLDPETRAKIEEMQKSGRLVLLGRDDKRLGVLFGHLKNVDSLVADSLRQEYPGFAEIADREKDLEKAVEVFNAQRPAEETQIHLNSLRQDVFANVAEKLSNALGKEVARKIDEAGTGGPLFLLAVPRGGVMMAQALKKRIPYKGLGHIKDSTDKSLPDELYEGGLKEVVVLDVAINTGKTMAEALRTLLDEAEVRPEDITLVTFASDPKALLRLMRMFPGLKRVYAVDLVPRVVNQEGVGTVFGKIGSKIMPLAWGVWKGTIEVGDKSLVVQGPMFREKSLISYLAIDEVSRKKYLLKTPIAPQTGKRLAQLYEEVQKAMPGAGMPRVEYDPSKRLLLTEFVPGLTLQTLGADKTLNAAEKTQALLQLLLDAARLIEVLKSHRRYPIFTPENLVWDVGQKRWFLTNLGPSSYLGKGHKEYNESVSLYSLREAWNQATQGAIGMHPTLADDPGLLAMRGILGEPGSTIAFDRRVLLATAPVLIQQAKPRGPPHPVRAPATSARKLLSAFTVQNERIIGTAHVESRALAAGDGVVRRILGIPSGEEIRYEIHESLGPLGAVRPHDNADDMIIEVSASALANALRLRRVLAHEHRHRIITKEGLFRAYPMDPALQEPLSEAFAILGEIMDILAQGDILSAIHDYSKLEETVEGRQPFKELLEYVRDNPRVDGKLLEEIAAFIERHRGDLYAGFAPAGIDLLRAQGLPLLKDPEFFSATLAKLSGVREDRWTGRQVALFSNFVDPALRSLAVQNAAADASMAYQTLGLLQHWINNSLQTADTSSYLLSKDPSRKSSADALQTAVTEILEACNALRGIQNPDALMDLDSFAGAKMRDMRSLLDAGQIPADKDPALLTRQKNMVKEIVSYFDPLVQDLASRVAAWQSGEGDLDALRASLQRLNEWGRNAWRNGRGLADVVIQDGKLDWAKSVAQDLQEKFPTSIPIFRKIQTPERELLPAQRTLARAKVSESGRFMEKETSDPEGFLDADTRRLLQKILTVFRRFGPQYRELIPQVTFTIVEGGPSLVTVRKDFQGKYEIQMDKVLLEGEPGIDMSPLLLLMINHELNHALLRDEQLGRDTDPVLEEIVVNATDLATYMELSWEHQRRIFQALTILEKKGFVTEPYRNFLPDPEAVMYSGRGSFAKLMTDKEDAADFFARAYAISTNPAANVKYAMHLGKMQDEMKQAGLESWDLGRAIMSSDYTGMAALLRRGQRNGRLLYVIQRELEKVCLEWLKAYDTLLNRLFADFDLALYKTEGHVNQDVENRILRKNLRILAGLGGPKVRKRLEDMLGVTDYSIVLRIAIAQAISDSAAPIYPASVKNPFFVRDLITHSRYLRSRVRVGILGEARLADLTAILSLFGKSRAESPRLYLDMRSELVAWLLYAQETMRRTQAPPQPAKEAKKRWIWKERDQATFQRAQELMQAAEKMLDLNHRAMLEMLGKKSLPQAEWSGKLQYERVPGEPLLTEIEPWMTPSDKEYLREDQDASRIAVESIRNDLMSGNSLRESIFLLYRKKIDESNIDKVSIRYLGRGQNKIVYHLRVSMKTGEIFNLARNFVKDPSFEDMEQEKKQSPIGYSVLQDEIYRLMLGEPPIFERFGALRMDEELIYWDEEFWMGNPLLKIGEPKAEVYFRPRPEEPLDARRQRTVDGIREYSKTCWEAWNVEPLRNTGLDINMWNVSANDEGKMRLIDAGLPDYADMPPDFLLRILWGVSMIFDRDPELEIAQPDRKKYPSIQIFMDKPGGEERAFNTLRHAHLENRFERISGSSGRAVYDGMLDALGEKKGMRVLREIFMKFPLKKKRQYEGPDGKKEEMVYVIEAPLSLEEYVRKGYRSYVPRQASRRLTQAEWARMLESPTTFTFEFYFANGLNKLRESPWIWTYLYRRFIQARAKAMGEPDERMSQALGQLVRDLRRFPNFLAGDRKGSRARWLEKLIKAFNLTASQAEMLRASSSYESAMASIMDGRMEKLLILNGYEGSDFPQERKDLIGMVVKANSDPGAAAWMLHTMLQSQRQAEFLRALSRPKSEAKGGFIVSKAFEGILRGLAREHYLDDATLLELLKNLPQEDLLPFIDYGRFPSLMREFILKDYRRVARSYEAIIRQDPDRAAELAGFSLVSEQMGYQGIAYLLDAFQRNSTREEWLNAVTGWRKVQGRWNSQWDGMRKGASVEIRQGLIPRAAQILGKYYEINPRGAADLLAGVLGKLRGNASKSYSRAGIQEFTDDAGNRQEDIFFLLGLLPAKLWESALESMGPAKAGQALANYLRVLVLMEKDSHGFQRDRWAMQAEKIVEVVRMLAANKPAITDAIVRHWLAMSDIPGEMAGYIFLEAPEHSIVYSAIQLMRTQPGAWEKLMLKVLNTRNLKAKERMLAINGRYVEKFLAAALSEAKPQPPSQPDRPSKHPARRSL